MLLALLTFFYFYEVELFQVEITSNGQTFIRDASFAELFIVPTTPSDFSIGLTLQGWLITLAIFIALPLMIAYRVTLKRYPRRAK